MLIKLVGVGEIRVTYDDEGKMLETKTFNDTGEEGGSDIALTVTSTFRKLMALQEALKSAGRDIPELPFVDEEADRLREAWNEVKWWGLDWGADQAEENSEKKEKYSREEMMERGLALTRYLITHLADRKSYENEAFSVLDSLLLCAMEAGASKKVSLMGLEAVESLYELYGTIRKDGLSADEWQAWGRIIAWLTSTEGKHKKVQKSAQKLLAKLEANPLRIIDFGEWLHKSYLSNPGFWRIYRSDNVIPRSRDISNGWTSVLIRTNGDIVVGTKKGFSVRNLGHWVFYAYDETAKRFSATLEPRKAESSSSVKVFAEHVDGHLWIGTEKGVIRLETQDYAGETTWYRTKDDGLPSPYVEHLVSVPEGIVVATNKGTVLLTGDGSRPLDALGTQPLLSLKSCPGPTGNENAQDKAAISWPIAFSNAKGVFVFSKGEKFTLTKNPAQHLCWDQEIQELFISCANELFSTQRKFDQETGIPTGFSELLRLQNQKQLLKTHKIEGLGLLATGNGDNALAVLTDRGMSLYRDYHFENLQLPYEDKPVPVYQLANSGENACLLTASGVRVIELGQVYYEKADVKSIIVDNDRNVTYLVIGGNVSAIDFSGSSFKLETLNYGYTNHMQLDAKGRIVADDRTQIIRIDPQTGNTEVLFTVECTDVPDNWLRSSGRSVTGLCIDRDGVIWVTYKASLFRYEEQPGDEAPLITEWNYFKDADTFPSISYELHGVYETVDGRIWVVASKESHLMHKGIELRGGLLEYTGKDFKRLDDISLFFITSYTPVDEKTAVVGTSSGFARHTPMTYTSFYSLDDATYMNLRGQNPNLYLSTGGVRFSGDLWLFGSAAGIVGYKGGQWFYPERLNWLLPEPRLALYGGRHIHALGLDKRCNLYAATDRGLLIYNFQGADAGFLVFNNKAQTAVTSLEQYKFQQTRNLFLDNLPEESEEAGLVRQYRENQQRITLIKEKQVTGVRLDKPEYQSGKRKSTAKSDEKGKDSLEKTETKEVLSEELERRERENRALLAKLMREDYGLYQLLSAKPLDLSAMARRLEEDQAVVHFIPTARELIIQVVTKDCTAVRQVEISRDSLFQKAMTAVSLLRRTALSSTLSSNTDSEESTEGILQKATDEEKLHRLLHELYVLLLRPVEGEIENKRHVFIVPCGSLHYLPFHALIRTLTPKPEYAVERFTLGVTPNLYLLEVALNHLPSAKNDVLVMCDPDGTLPGARREGQAVQKILLEKVLLKEGKEASYGNLKTFGPACRIIHLATHAVLDAARPEKSYLLLAGDHPSRPYKLNLIDASVLPLDDTDVAVLSACETGVGAEGYEFQTLVRALAHAGVGSLVGTLWKVPDDASAELMSVFYKLFKEMNGSYYALTHAQRELLKQSEYREHPGRWAGYVAFGKP